MPKDKNKNKKNKNAGSTLEQQTSVGRDPTVAVEKSTAFDVPDMDSTFRMSRRETHHQLQRRTTQRRISTPEIGNASPSTDVMAFSRRETSAFGSSMTMMTRKETAVSIVRSQSQVRRDSNDSSPGTLTRQSTSVSRNSSVPQFTSGRSASQLSRKGTRVMARNAEENFVSGGYDTFSPETTDLLINNGPMFRGTSPDRVSTPQKKKRAKKRSAAPIDTKQLVTNLAANSTLSLDRLFDKNGNTNCTVLTYAFRQSLSLLSTLFVNLFKLKQRKHVTASIVGHLIQTYAIDIPERYSRTQTIPFLVVSKALLECDKLDVFIKDALKLQGTRVGIEDPISRSDFATFLVYFRLTDVLNQMMLVGAMCDTERNARHDIIVTELNDPSHPRIFYDRVVKPNLAAASVQRFWRCKKAKQEMTRRVRLRQQGVYTDLNTYTAIDDTEQEKTWRERSRQQTLARSSSRGQLSRQDRLLRWLSFENIKKIFEESSYLYPAVIGQMIGKSDPKHVVPSNNLLWLCRAYSFYLPAETACREVTLWDVTEMIKKSSSSFTLIFEDILKLVGITRVQGGLKSDAFEKLIQFYDVEPGLRHELQELGLLLVGGVLMAGVFYSLADVHSEAKQRLLITDDGLLQLQLMHSRYQKFANNRQRATNMKPIRRQSISVRTAVRRPLTDFKNNKELILHGQAGDYECVITTQAVIRSFLSRLHFKHAVLLFRAAVKVQTRWKGVIARRHFQSILTAHRLKQEAASIKIQSRWRRQDAVNQYRQSRTDIILIQSLGRAMNLRCRLCRWRNCIATFQRIGSGLRDRWRLSCVRYNLKVIRLQCIWRQHFAVKELLSRRLQLKSILVLQRISQSYAVRSMIRNLFYSYRLQRVMRGGMSRDKMFNFRKQVKSATKLQSQWRTSQAKTLLARKRIERNSAEVIQRTWRCKNAKDTAATKRSELKAATTIQNSWRCSIARKIHQSLLIQRKALRYLQVIGKGYFGRLAVSELFISMLNLNKYKLSCMMTLRRIFNAFKQRCYVYQLYNNREWEKRIYDSRLRLQYVGKGFLGRLLCSSIPSLKRLQRIGRGYRGRLNFSKLSYSVIRLQKVGRAFTTRTLLMNNHGGVLTTCGVSDLFGGGLFMKILLSQAECGRRITGRAVKKLQSCGRGLRTRLLSQKEYKIILQAIRVIQQSGRGFNARLTAKYNHQYGVEERACNSYVIPSLRDTLFITRLQFLKKMYFKIRSSRGSFWKIQRLGKAYLGRRELFLRLGAVLAVQKIGKGLLGRAIARIHLLNRKSAITIQQMTRMVIAKSKLEALRIQSTASKYIQKITRGAASRLYMRRLRAAFVIQKHWRSYNSYLEDCAVQKITDSESIISKTCAGYRSRLFLSQKKPKSIETIRRVSIGATTRLNLRIKKGMKCAETGSVILHRNIERHRRVRFYNLLRYSSLMIQAKQRSMLNEAILRRLIKLTEVRTMKYCLRMLNRKVIIKSNVLKFQRMGRGLVHRSVLGKAFDLIKLSKQIITKVSKGFFHRKMLIDLYCRSTTVVAMTAFVAVGILYRRRCLTQKADAFLEYNSRRYLASRHYSVLRKFCAASAKSKLRRKAAQRLLMRTTMGSLSIRYHHWVNIAIRRKKIQSAVALQQVNEAHLQRKFFINLRLFSQRRIGCHVAITLAAATVRIPSMVGCLLFYNNKTLLYNKYKLWKGYSAAPPPTNNFNVLSYGVCAGIIVLSVSVCQDSFLSNPSKIISKRPPSAPLTRRKYSTWCAAASSVCIITSYVVLRQFNEIDRSIKDVSQNYICACDAAISGAYLITTVMSSSIRQPRRKVSSAQMKQLTKSSEQATVPITPKGNMKPSEMISSLVSNEDQDRRAVCFEQVCEFSKFNVDYNFCLSGISRRAGDRVRLEGRLKNIEYKEEKHRVLIRMKQMKKWQSMQLSQENRCSQGFATQNQNDHLALLHERKQRIQAWDLPQISKTISSRLISVVNQEKTAREELESRQQSNFEITSQYGNATPFTRAKSLPLTRFQSLVPLQRIDSADMIR